MYATISSFPAHATTAVGPNPGFKKREREGGFSDKMVNRGSYHYGAAETNLIVSMRMQVPSLASLSGLS